jgi:hypothetical protein
MSVPSPEEIQGIIERVKLRLGEPPCTAGPGAGAVGALRGREGLSQVSGDEFGEGIYATVREAVAAAGRAFATFQPAGFELA